MSMRLMYGGPPRVPPGGSESMKRLRAELEANVAKRAEDEKAQEDFMRLAGVPDDVAKAALGQHETYEGRFKSWELLGAIANLARQGAFVDRRWAKRIKRLERRAAIARNALDGDRDEEQDDLAVADPAVAVARGINDGTLPGISGATARVVAPMTIEVVPNRVGRDLGDDDGA